MTSGETRLLSGFVSRLLLSSAAKSWSNSAIEPLNVITSSFPEVPGKGEMMEQPHESVEQAVARLYEDYHQPIVRYLRRITRSPEAAEDLAQETFLKAFRHWHQLVSPEGAVAWLFRIARHTAYDDGRRHRRSHVVPLTELHTETIVAQHAELAIEDRAPIQAALSQLADHYRVPPLLHSYAGYPVETIAQAMGCKVGTVKSRLARARAQFRQHYSP